MSTERSTPETAVRRVEAEAAELGLSRAEYLARSAARWLADLETPRAAAAFAALLADVHRATTR